MIRLLAQWLTTGVLLAAFADAAWSQTTINGNGIALHSTGSASGNAWILDRDGYVGTYITLAAPGDVTINVQAEGTPDGGVDPNMNVVIADTKAGFDVVPGVGIYSHTYSLPAGTYFVRTEFNNDVGVTPRQLTVDNITVSGATVVNASTTSNALAASDTYIANYRKGAATIGLSGLAPGTPVQVSMKRIAFNFGNAVPGTSQGGINTYLGNGNTPQQTNYQAHLNQNFNAITEENAGKWAYNEATQNNVTMAGVDTILSYAQAHNMRARMHNVIWGDNGNHGQQPSWVLNGTNGLLDQAATGNSTAATNLRNAISSRIKYFAGDGPGGGADRALNYDEIDVYNESYHTGESPGTLTHNYWTAYGPDGVAGIYNEVKQAAANSGASTKVFVNEYSVLEDGSYGNFFVRNLEAIRSAGFNDGFGDVLGGIGSQYYPNSTSSSRDATIERTLQNLDVQGLPIALTEFGVQSAVSTTTAASILSDTLRLVFGNPNSTGFFMWGFQSENGGGNLFAPQAALYTVNTSDWSTWTITQAGKNWQDQLGIQDWDGNPNNGWNTQLTASVDAGGTINFSGYYGDYQITAGGHTYNLTLTKGTSQYAIVVAAGDYNGDGIVDAADYTVWRDTFGSATDLRADGNGDGMIDDDDYATWASNFGVSYPGSGAGSAATIPEPSSFVLMFIAGCAVATPRKFHKSSGT
jgi:GH35 family endo-1,4-beta-xylanase